MSRPKRARRNARNKESLSLRALAGSLGRRAWPVLRAVPRAWPAFLFLLLVAIVWRQLNHAGYFRVDDIRVSQCEHVAADQLRDYLHTRRGQNIFSVDLESLAQRVLSHPWVRSVVVRRDLPNALVVEVTERHAVAMLEVGRLYLVDEDGTVFKQCAKGDPTDLPLLTGFDPHAFEAGGAAARLQAAKIAGAVELLHLSRATAGLADREISEVRWDVVGGYALITTDAGLTVRLGEGAFPEKLRNFGAVAQTLDAKFAQAAQIDLAVLGRVVVRGLRKGNDV